ncbi:MAG: glycosyltransferase family 39 protein [Phycisphaerales bacterium]|nr:glycosyltransferase family 39 protein [Phycisphaerales bacterium]MCB9855893.1 glycosyltransferase family 39 protein [Phycisphaerales bacterium]
MTAKDDLSREQYGNWLRLVVLAACMLRIALVGFAAEKPEPFDFPDSHRYVRVARNIAEGNGPVESRTALSATDPVYPTMLAWGIRFGGRSTAAIMSFGRAINGVFGVIVVALVAAMGSRLYSRRVGLLAAGWCAIDPILLFFNALVLTELPYIAMLMGAVLLVIRFRSSRQIGDAFAAGVILGVATLTRSSGLFLPLLIAGWIVLVNWRSKDRLRSIAAAALMLVAMLIVMSPVIYRNHRLFGAFVPVRTGGGASLMEALGPWADGAPGMDRIEYPQVPPGANEVQRDRVYQDAAIAWAKAHPGDVMRLAWRKLARTWSITMNAPGFQSGFYAIVCWLSVAPIFLLTIVGVWVERRRFGWLSLLLLPAAYFTLIHMVFVGSVRYRLPAMPFLFILAAVGVCAILRMNVRRPGGTEA